MYDMVLNSLLFQKYSKIFVLLEISAKSFPEYIYLFKVNNRSNRKMCEIYSKLTIKTPERGQWRRFDVFIHGMEWGTDPSPQSKNCKLATIGLQAKNMKMWIWYKQLFNITGKKWKNTHEIKGKEISVLILTLYFNDRVIQLHKKVTNLFICLPLRNDLAMFT